MEKIRLDKISGIIPTLFTVIKTRQERNLDFMLQRLNTGITKKIMEDKHKLEMAATKIEALNPERLLKRGYSITLFNGKAIRDPKTLKTGDEILTKIEKGTIKSTVK